MDEFSAQENHHVIHAPAFKFLKNLSSINIFLVYVIHLIKVVTCRRHFTITPRGRTGALKTSDSSFFNPLTPNDLQIRRAVRTTHHATRHNTPIHNVLSTAPQLSISQKALGTLPEDGNVMLKHE
jgi:hypothetical protein